MLREGALFCGAAVHWVLAPRILTNMETKLAILEARPRTLIDPAP